MGTIPCTEIRKERKLAHSDCNESKIVKDLIVLKSNQPCRPKIQAIPRTI